MVKVYIVFLNYGFNGVKFFKKYSNAKKFADLKKENVEIESATPKEFTEIIFEDWAETVRNDRQPWDSLPALTMADGKQKGGNKNDKEWFDERI